jgi:hypothetical protein
MVPVGQIEYQGKVFPLVNVIIVTFVRPNLLLFKMKATTGHKIIAYKLIIYFEHKATVGVQ